MADSKSDVKKIAQAVLDESSQAVKATLVNTAISIELSADDGDSVITKVENQSVNATVANGVVSGTVVIGPSNATLHAQYQFLVRNVGALTATDLKVVLQGNPMTADANSDWFEINSTTISTLTDGFLTLGSVAPSMARRYRVVVTHSGFSAGSIVIYLMHR